MSPDDDKNDLRSLWQAQPVKEKLVMSTEELMKKESRLTLRLRIRNATEYMAGALVVGVFSWLAIRIPFATSGPHGGIPAEMLRAACLLVVLGVVVVVWKLRKDGAPLPAPAVSASTAEHLAHHRASLARQRDLLRRVVVWYVGPFIPGILLLFVAIALMVARAAPFEVWALGIAKPALVVVGVLLLVVWNNRMAARKLQEQLDALGE